MSHRMMSQYSISRYLPILGIQRVVHQTKSRRVCRQGASLLSRDHVRHRGERRR
jgi:hypothetical protein